RLDEPLPGSRIEKEPAILQRADHDGGAWIAACGRGLDCFFGVAVGIAGKACERRFQAFGSGARTGSEDDPEGNDERDYAFAKDAHHSRGPGNQKSRRRQPPPPIMSRFRPRRQTPPPHFLVTVL